MFFSLRWGLGSGSHLLYLDKSVQKFVNPRKYFFAFQKMIKFYLLIRFEISISISIGCWMILNQNFSFQWRIYLYSIGVTYTSIFSDQTFKFHRKKSDEMDFFFQELVHLEGHFLVVLPILWNNFIKSNHDHTYELLS